MRRTFLFALLGTVSFVLSSHYCTQLSDEEHPSSPEFKTENVVVLVIDGPRYSETYGETEKKYIPFLADSLLPKGVFFESFFNQRVTLTVSGHAALTTGKYERLSNNGDEIPSSAGMFHYFEKSFPNEKAWLIASKGKLGVLADSKELGPVKNLNLYCGIDGKGVGYSSDSLTMIQIKKVLRDDSPKLMLINLLDVDVAGHAKDYDRYIKAIKNTDRCAWEIWQTIQSNPKMRDKTSLLITNDHGRHLDGHKDGFASHGDMCTGCRKISLLAIGPDFEANKVVSAKHQMIEIAPTVAELLKIKMPKVKGKSLLPVLLKQ